MFDAVLSRLGHSIDARFRLVVVAVFALGTLVSLASAWYDAGAAADESYDRLLQSAAVQFLDSAVVVEDAPQLVPPVSAFDTLGIAADDRFYYAVRRGDGTFVTGYDDLPEVAPAPSGAGLRESAMTRLYREQDVRFLTVSRAMGNAEQAARLRVTVGQTLLARKAMQRQLFLRAAPAALVLSLLGFMATLRAARLAVRPLARLSALIEAREPGNLKRIDMEGPRETEGLVRAINGLVSRVEARLGTMQFFARLTAHQLRTPLTALGAQLDLLANEATENRQVRRIARLKDRLTELNRLIHQLLGHAMIAYRGEAALRQDVDLCELVRQAAIDLIEEAGAFHCELAVDLPDVPIMVKGDAVMLREAVMNLIHNAMTHGGPGMIRIAATSRGGRVVLAVADQGPGILPEQWPRAVQPFALKRQSELGAGLGLSIVHETARAHGGTLAFGRDAEGLFEVRIELPGDEA